MRIGLVACTKRKQPYPCAARQMYSPSALFRKASAYCAREYDTWYILSAEYGLLSPDETIQPYDKTLKTMSHAQCEGWGRKVSAQLKGLGDHRYFAHAGLAYLRPLSGMNIVSVLAGLRMGERLRWYDEHLAEEADIASSRRGTHEAWRLDRQLTVEQLARAAEWYRQNTHYNTAYSSLLSQSSFLTKLQNTPDQLSNGDVLDNLIKGFLNPFRARLPNSIETATAIRSRLVRVAEEVRGLAHENLLEVNLSQDPGAMGTHIPPTYEVIRTAHRVGPTTTSKILHALNPALFVMWDSAIRDHYSGLVGRKLVTGADYLVFLAHMQELARSVVRDFSLRHEHALAVDLYLSEHLGLEAPVTLAKFLDEYNWVTIVRRVVVP